MRVSLAEPLLIQLMCTRSTAEHGSSLAGTCVTPVAIVDATCNDFPRPNVRGVIRAAEAAGAAGDPVSPVYSG